MDQLWLLRSWTLEGFGESLLSLIYWEPYLLVVEVAFTFKGYAFTLITMVNFSFSLIICYCYFVNPFTLNFFWSGNIYQPTYQHVNLTTYVLLTYIHAHLSITGAWVHG